MRNFSLFLKLTLIVGIIGLLNFTNFDLDHNTSLATENTQSQEATLIENASNPDSTQSKEIYTVQKANLGATDSFDPDAIPYFRTETSTYSNSAASITITNHWTSTIKVVFTLTSGSVYSQTTIDPADSKSFNISNETVDLTISAIDKDGFRNWSNPNNPFIKTSGESESQFASFVHIPDMRYFTVDEDGTTAGGYFFSFFNREGSITSLPEGSFNISTITSASHNFFSSFNESGNLTSLPAGSFDTSNITSVGSDFFSYFNYSGKLTSLPEGSFDISNITLATSQFLFYFNCAGKLTTLPENSFDTSNITSASFGFFSGFNSAGSLTSLPEGSFNTSSITSVNNHFFSNFNYGGKLTSLPEGSFNTSSITSAGSYFFYYFNTEGYLTSLPRSSFNFNSLITQGDYAFMGFNQNGSLTSLPYNSFYIPGSFTVDGNSWENFNKDGQLTKFDTGVVIRNTNGDDVGVAFYFKEGGGSSYIIVNPGYSFTAYAMDVVLSFDSDGGSNITSITALQGNPFTKPANPTKSGYKFIQWVLKDGTVYDWDSTATDNLTLYAEWEELPSPTPTTSPTKSPTTSPAPTKSPTSSPSPSSSNSLPVTGDDSWNIFTFGGISLFVGMILLTLTLVNRRTKRITRQENYRGKLKE